jgi:hypothetical protein
LEDQDGDPSANRAALKIRMLRRTFVDRSSGSFLRPPVVCGIPDGSPGPKSDRRGDQPPAATVAVANLNAATSALRNLTTSISLSLISVKETLENLGSER